MSYGFLLTTFNDGPQAVKMYESLKDSINGSYSICVVDGGSDEKNLDLITSNIGAVIGPYKDLSVALNAGYYSLLGYEPDGSNINEFVKTGNAGVDYIFWIHCDMKFNDINWAEKLIYCYEYCWPMFGRLGPGTRNIDNSTPSVVLRGGNQCPHVMSATFLQTFISKYGYVYNPEYVNCGGYEDWHNGRQILELGSGFGICSLVDVWHEGMGTRKLSDTRLDQINNANVYEKNWGTWNQPGFELDLTELGNNLKMEFEKKFNKVWYKND
jgi:hypothetical protein